MADKQTVYLGDGAYAEYDGWGFTIFASNGLERTDSVYLEPEVLASFQKFIDAMKLIS